MEAYTTGAFDFKQYANNRDSISWIIKRNLVLSHMSMKISRDGAAAIRGCKNEYIDSLVDQFVGTFGKMEQKHQDEENKTVKLVDTKTIMSMSQDQLKSLYDTIIKQVIGTGNE